MSDLRLLARVSLALAVASLLAMPFAHLALTDIAHGDGNLRAEWLAVQISAAVIAASVIAAAVTAFRVLRAAR